MSEDVRYFLPSARRPKPGRPRKAESGHVPGTSDAGSLDRSGQHSSTLACQATAPLPCSTETAQPTKAQKQEERRLRALTAVAPRLLDVPEAAVYLGLPEASVYDLAARGVLRRVRVPLPDGSEYRKVLFDRADLDRLIDAWKA